jgi:hypothetical protein
MLGLDWPYNRFMTTNTETGRTEVKYLTSEEAPANPWAADVPGEAGWYWRLDGGEWMGPAPYGQKDAERQASMAARGSLIR